MTQTWCWFVSLYCRKTITPVYTYCGCSPLVYCPQPGQGLQPADEKSLFSTFAIPMSRSTILTYEPVCNTTNVDDVLMLAYMSSNNPPALPSPSASTGNSSMDLYMAFSGDDSSLMAPGGSRDLANMSFTMIGVDDPVIQLQEGTLVYPLLSLSSWLLTYSSVCSVHSSCDIHLSRHGRFVNA